MAFSIDVNVAGVKPAGIRQPDVSQTGVYAGLTTEAERLTSGKGNDVTVVRIKITEECPDKGLVTGIVLSNDFDKDGVANYWRPLMETITPKGKEALLEKGPLKVTDKMLTDKKVYFYADVPPAGEKGTDGKPAKIRSQFITLSEYSKYKTQNGAASNGAASKGTKAAPKEDEQKDETPADDENPFGE